MILFPCNDLSRGPLSKKQRNQEGGGSWHLAFRVTACLDIDFLSVSALVLLIIELKFAESSSYKKNVTAFASSDNHITTSCIPRVP